MRRSATPLDCAVRGPGRRPRRPGSGRPFRLAEVRLRVPIVLVVAAVVIGRWDVIRNYWDRFTRSVTSESTRPSAGLERHRVFLPDGSRASCPTGRGGAGSATWRWCAASAARPWCCPTASSRGCSSRRTGFNWRESRRRPLTFSRCVASVESSGLVVREPVTRRPCSLEIPARQAPWIAEGQAAEVDCADLPGQRPDGRPGPTVEHRSHRRLGISPRDDRA